MTEYNFWDFLSDGETVNWAVAVFYANDATVMQAERDAK